MLPELGGTSVQLLGTVAQLIHLLSSVLAATVHTSTAALVKRLGCGPAVTASLSSGPG
jgi:hypothetical protein